MGKKTKQSSQTPVFVVESPVNTQVQKELADALASARSRLISYILIALLIAAAALFFDRYIEFGGIGNLLVLLLTVAGLGYLIYVYAFLPKKNLRRWEETVFLAYGVREAHLVTRFYEKSLSQTLQEDGTLTVQDYSGLTELRETEHLFLLCLKGRQWFFVNKEGFTTGTPEEFRTFISARIGGKATSQHKS